MTSLIFYNTILVICNLKQRLHWTAPHVVRRQSDAVYNTCAPRGGHIDGARGVVGPRRPTRVASLALSAGSLVRSPSTPPVWILAAGVPVSYSTYLNKSTIYFYVLLSHSVLLTLHRTKANIHSEILKNISIFLLEILL